MHIPLFRDQDVTRKMPGHVYLETMDAITSWSRVNCLKLSK